MKSERNGIGHQAAHYTHSTMSLTAFPGPLQVEQMARDWLAANVSAQTFFDIAVRPCQSLVLAEVLVP